MKLRSQLRKLLTVVFLVIPRLGGAEPVEEPVRIGFFPNVTHGQALYLQSEAGASAVQLPTTWTMFTAGPTAVEALLSDEIDASYIGPNPAVNGYIKSRGEKFVIISGAALGGAGLVVRADAGITSPSDFNNKTIATPQLGNTQDVAAREWFTKNGYRFKDVGGTLNILPIAPADQLNLMRRKELDGAWTVEPWLSRLELEAGARLLVDENTLWPAGRYATTLLVVRRSVLKSRPEAVRKILKQHRLATEALRHDPQQAQTVINQQLKKLTGQQLADAVIARALTRITFTWDCAADSVRASAAAAYRVGFLRAEPKLDGLFALDMLEASLKEAGLPVPAQ